MNEEKGQTIILKGEAEAESDEVLVENYSVDLDNPAFIMARRIASVLMEDYEIVKIGFRPYEDKKVDHYGKLTIYCINHLKTEALKELWVDNIGAVDIEIVHLFDQEGWTASLAAAAFFGNPLVRDVRTKNHLASGIQYNYVICSRDKLCQFSSANSADYQGNYTELPQNILTLLNRDGYGFQYCTEV